MWRPSGPGTIRNWWPERCSSIFLLAECKCEVLGLRWIWRSVWQVISFFNEGLSELRNGSCECLWVSAWRVFWKPELRTQRWDVLRLYFGHWTWELIGGLTLGKPPYIAGRQVGAVFFLSHALYKPLNNANRKRKTRRREWRRTIKCAIFYFLPPGVNESSDLDCVTGAQRLICNWWICA
jgi:hypothetical protein